MKYVDKHNIKQAKLQFYSLTNDIFEIKLQAYRLQYKNDSILKLYTKIT